MIRMLALAFLAFVAVSADALLREPAVSATHVAFVYDNQVWVVRRGMSTPVRITSSPGRKFNPRFSPDGRSVAFGTAQDLYTVPIAGGTPARATYLPSTHVLTQWTADGRLLFYTNALSFVRLETQLFTVSPRGEMPQRLPLAYGSDGAIDETGTWLAYTPQWPNNLINHWKRYRGGAAPDIHVVNLRTHESTKITTWEGVDLRPMWHGRTLYYVSDGGEEKRLNVWAYDTTAKTRRQITHFADYDVNNASVGDNAIVFEHGPELRLLDLATERSSALKIEIPRAQRAATQRDVDASRFITNRQLSRDGSELFFEARGDLWIGTRNLTATSGAFEREASRSPDGRWIAYSSDVSGEYEIYIRAANGNDTRQLTHFGGGFRFRPVWSPDSRRIAFFDQTMTIFVCDVESAAMETVDKDPWAEQPELAWSSDSTWLAYTRTGDDRVSSLWRYDVATRARTRLTASAFQAGTPAFDRAGRFLFFISYRNFNTSVYDWLAQRIVHRATSVLMAVPIASTHNVDDCERNAIRLGTATGAIASLAGTFDGDVIFSFTETNGARSVRRYDVDEKKEEVLANGTNEFELAADGRHLLLPRDNKLFVRDLGAPDAAETELPIDAMKVTIDLRTEWRELYADAWRIVRDFFYAPKVAGTFDWNDVRRRYAPMIEAADTREDVNWILAEMLGEVGVGHAYMGAPGDIAPFAPSDAIGMLGADFTPANGAFRIARIYEGAPWDDLARSPLRAVREGELLFAVNGVAVDPTRDPRAAFVGLAGKSVTLRIGADAASARDVVVTPRTSDNELRHAAWIESNRAYVEKASGGRVGYVRIPEFTTGGFNEFARQFQGQIEKDALIFDPRWSQGGWIGAVLAETLARPELNSAASRESTHAWPAFRYGAHQGPKAVLLNHLVVSAGENFAYYFRKLGLGPLIGTRTWGGLTGLNPVPSLLDGGSLNVPNAPFFDASGWLIEGHGIDPDEVIEDDPAQRGPMDVDPQLAAAVKAIWTAAAQAAAF